MNDFLKSRYLYMLFILPFLVVGIILLNEYFPDGSLSGASMKGMLHLPFIAQLSRFWQLVVGGVSVLAVAYLIFYISERFKLFQQTTTLASLIYVLLITRMMVDQSLDSLSIAIFVIAFAVIRLQCAIHDTQHNNTLYDFGFLAMSGVLIYPKFILLIPWALCVGFFSGRSTPRDISALLLGIITPIIFLVFAYFWMGELSALPGLFYENLIAGEYLRRLSIFEMVRWSIFLLLLLFSLYSLLNKYSLLVVSLRRGLLSLVSMFLFLVPTVFILPLCYHDFVCILAFPLSYIYAQYFITNRIVFVGNLMFFLFLCACFIHELLIFDWTQLLWW